MNELEQWIVSGAVAATPALDRRVLERARVALGRRWRRWRIALLVTSLAASLAAVTAVATMWPGAGRPVDEPGAPATYLGWPRRLDIAQTLRRAPWIVVVVLRGAPAQRSEARIARVLKGPAELAGEPVTLVASPFGQGIGAAWRSCLCTTNLIYRSGENLAGTCWLLPLKPLDGRGADGRLQARNPVSEGLQATRVAPNGAGEIAAAPRRAVLDELLAGLRDASGDVRFDCARALRVWEGERLDGTVGEQLWRDEKVVRQLLAAGRDRDPRVRWVIAWMVPAAAGEAGEHLLLERLFDPVRMVRQPARARLAKLGFTEIDDALAEVADFVLDEQTSWVARAYWSTPAGDPTKWRARLLADLRDNPDAATRARLAWQLGQEPAGAAATEVVAALIDAAADPGAEVRRGAVCALGRLGVADLGAALAHRVEQTVRTAAKDPDGRVRVAAGRALDALGTAGAVELLSAQAADPVAVVAVEAIEALTALRRSHRDQRGAFRAPPLLALDAIERSLGDDRAVVRAFAVASLPTFHRLARHRVEALIGDVAGDTSPVVQAAVEAARAALH